MKKILRHVVRAVATLITIVPSVIVIRAASTSWLTVIAGFSLCTILYFYSEGFGKEK